MHIYKLKIFIKERKKQYTTNNCQCDYNWENGCSFKWNTSLNWKMYSKGKELLFQNIKSGPLQSDWCKIMTLSKTRRPMVSLFTPIC